MKTRVTFNIVLEISVEKTNFSPANAVSQILGEARQTCAAILRDPERLAQALASGDAKVLPGETITDFLLTGVS